MQPNLILMHFGPQLSASGAKRLLRLVTKLRDIAPESQGGGGIWSDT